MTDNADQWQVRTDIAHPARVYDYWLGGKDNFAIDREAAEAVLRVMPEILITARGNRQFLARAVRFVAEQGVRQFLDIGSGLPTSPNVHEVARAVQPDARVVYVDNDPIVSRHAEAYMAKDRDLTRVIWADLRDSDAVIGGAAELLDYREPVGLLFVGCLHHILDDDDPAGVVARYLAALAPGSYLVLSHGTDEIAPEKMRANSEEGARRGAIFIPRSRVAIERMFNSRKLLDPGLVLASYWRPEGNDPGPNADLVWAYAGVAAV